MLASGLSLRLDAYQPRLRKLASEIADIDIREYELASAEVIAAELQGRTFDLLDAARSLLSEILETCEKLEASSDRHRGTESVRDSYLSFDQALDSSVARSPQDVGEIGFIAGLELGQRLERLRRATAARGAASLLAECDGALRRARRALSAVDAAIAAAEETDPLVPYTSILESSLAVRRAYAKFRRSLGVAGAATSLHRRLRAAGTQIAIVIGWSVYPEMRVSDRLLLRGLQQRILDWLRSTDAEALDGERLWQDFVGFVEMLSLVNRRQELVEHDRAALEGLAQQLGDPTAGDDQLAAHLASLAGLDDELDAVASKRPLARAELRATLERLRLGRPSGGSF